MTLAEQIKATNEQLKALKAQYTSKTFANKLTVRIGDKGTLNIYGLAKFPICLYLSQLVRVKELLNNPEFEAFVQENQEKIAVKKEA